uniref:Uncharacterized protein n=1 Tax=Fusarium oxysporum (strain Fo5176) TaxID=660025 RepID=A0A0D2YFD5_FUSOF
MAMVDNTDPTKGYIRVSSSIPSPTALKMRPQLTLKAATGNHPSSRLADWAIHALPGRAIKESSNIQDKRVEKIISEAEISWHYDAETCFDSPELTPPPRPDTRMVEAAYPSRGP